MQESNRYIDLELAKMFKTTIKYKILIRYLQREKSTEFIYSQVRLIDILIMSI